MGFYEPLKKSTSRIQVKESPKWKAKAHIIEGEKMIMITSKTTMMKIEENW